MKNNFQTGQHFHCTIAIKGGNILAIGKNNYQKEHPKQKFGIYNPKRCGYKTYKACLHSEIDCIKQLGVRNDYHKITLLNIRINNNNQIANAEPCANCKRVVSKYNFKRIYFTIKKKKIGRFTSI